MTDVQLVGLLVAVFLLLAALSVPAGRISLGWLGMLLWFLLDHYGTLVFHSTRVLH